MRHIPNISNKKWSHQAHLWLSRALQGIFDLQGRRVLSTLIMNVFTPALLLSKLGSSVDARQVSWPATTDSSWSPQTAQVTEASCFPHATCIALLHACCVACGHCSAAGTAPDGCQDGHQVATPCSVQYSLIVANNGI